MRGEAPGRVLVVDDQAPILADFARLLEPSPASADVELLDELERQLRGPVGPLGQRSLRPPTVPPFLAPRYQVRYARQGAEAIREAQAARARGEPFAVAFVDIHMPPGIDGIETVAALWRDNPELEVVLCTAYSDHSWQTIQGRLGNIDQLLILRKPFDPIEVRQLAASLCEKWRRGRRLAERVQDLEARIAAEVAARIEHDQELQRAQKCEALGRLAAGIAHEINTPTQFIQSSLEFLGDAFAELHAVLAGTAPAALAATLAEIPIALADANEGVERITRIVRSVREYAHPGGSQEAALVDVNHQLRAVAELARGQYKHDAELVLDLGEVPPILGHAEELSRAFLNLVVNAAQAVQAARGAHGPLGRIAITTRARDGAVLIDVADTGVGIPDAIRERVFDPFFTTKAVGQGTGQGLMFARAAVVDGHQGTLSFDSEPGRGTTFHVALPMAVEVAR
jgi:signal transduction histidine kinase